SGDLRAPLDYGVGPPWPVPVHARKEPGANDLIRPPAGAATANPAPEAPSPAGPVDRRRITGRPLPSADASGPRRTRSSRPSHTDRPERGTGRRALSRDA